MKYSNAKHCIEELGRDKLAELLEEFGDSLIEQYIDWERTARDIMMDYFEIDGFYFRNL